MQRRHILSSAAAAIVGTPLAILPGAAWAAYPEKPVVLVVPFPPGGPADGYGRAFAQALSIQSLASSGTCGPTTASTVA